ncbi:hypothetical protein JOB18_011383 [Solea senegalensis]|uniref:Uncharacterized protein n=1 Tax=Solea senegalensis TaxID=28829 RepID=A0AAV6SJF3_SOLSE|nr:hypothetical protein JOB18_011383 [Solea senegalensis]
MAKPLTHRERAGRTPGPRCVRRRRSEGLVWLLQGIPNVMSLLISSGRDSEIDHRRAAVTQIGRGSSSSSSSGSAACGDVREEKKKQSIPCDPTPKPSSPSAMFSCRNTFLDL